jgi:trigger factor
MKATVEPLENNRVKVSVEVDEAEFDKAVDAAFRKIAREVRIPGFRPGKAPRRLLEAKLGTEVGREEALRDALPEYYSKAVREHDVDVIAPPEIEITGGQEEGPIAFDAVVEIRPRISVPGYGGLRVTLERPDATDEEIDGQVDRLREQFGELRSVERPAAAGDHASINIQGSRGGEAAPGLSADDYLYEVGSGSIVPELDQQLRGAKVGDVLEFSATMPGTDTDAVDFRVLLKDVKEKLLPAVDDEWANEVSEFETVDDLRADIANRITGVRRMQAQLALRERAIEALVELVEDDAPDPLVGLEVQHRLEDLAMRLSAQGLSAEQYLTMRGVDQEALVAELRDVAVQAVKADLALRAVADAEGIEVDDDDLDAEYSRIAERVGQPASKVRGEFERGEQVAAVRSDLRKRKALDWLLEHVEIVDPAGEPVDRTDLEPVALADHDHDHDHDEHGDDHHHVDEPEDDQ